MSAPRTVRGRVPVAWEAGWTLRLPAGAPPPEGHAVLLALHGFGDDGERLGEVLAAALPAPYALLLPDGPFPVEMRQATPRIGRAWYQYTGDQDAFLAALRFAGGHLDEVLAAAVRAAPLDHSRVAVLGYSQGGYLAGHYALTRPERFRGLVAAACRVKVEALREDLPRARGFPVRVVHGARDAAVPRGPAEDAAAVLRDHGLEVEVAVHEGGHGLPREAVAGIDGFVRRVLGIDSEPAPARGVSGP